MDYRITTASEANVVPRKNNCLRLAQMQMEIMETSLQMNPQKKKKH